jgi:nitroreductase
MTPRHRQNDVLGSGPVDVRHRVETRYPVLPELLDRWSPRDYTDREPEPDKLGSIFEAARLAPSAHNSQPSRFIVGRRGHGGTYERLFACLDPHNRDWAHVAPVLVLGAVSRRRFSQLTGDFVPYAHSMHDLGLAVMSLIVQAQHLGLHCHPMAAFDPERAQEEFAIPPLFLPAIMITVGYLGSSEPRIRTGGDAEVGRRTRRQLEELVFEEAWGQAASLFALDRH